MEMWQLGSSVLLGLVCWSEATRRVIRGCAFCFRSAASFAPACVCGCLRHRLGRLSVTGRGVHTAGTVHCVFDTHDVPSRACVLCGTLLAGHRLGHRLQAACVCVRATARGTRATRAHGSSALETRWDTHAHGARERTSGLRSSRSRRFSNFASAIWERESAEWERVLSFLYDLYLSRFLTSYK